MNLRSHSLTKPILLCRLVHHSSDGSSTLTSSGAILRHAMIDLGIINLVLGQYQSGQSHPAILVWIYRVLKNIILDIAAF